MQIYCFWFYRYILLGNLFNRIYQFFDFIDISRSETFPSKYIDFLILLIYLARKPFRAYILIFWFYWNISLKNLFERIYRFFDFYHISRSETFSGECIDIPDWVLYLAKNILIKKFLNLDFQFIFLLKPQFFSFL